MLARARIIVSGLVQGVGFRPFCYREAQKQGLHGFVRNAGDGGVEIMVEGERDAIKRFLDVLKQNPPPLAEIDTVRVEWDRPSEEFKDFKVIKSEKTGVGAAPIVPADIHICEACLHEMHDPRDRRYLYPFTTCVNCGPRFTIIEALPYDRERTSMREFPLCNECRTEYTDPNNRRYHAEPTCCPNCGPKVVLLNTEGRPIETSHPFAEVAKMLDDGQIGLIKGIGGMHIACKTSEDQPLQRLREILRRPQQPFALMSSSIEKIKTFAELSDQEIALLRSPRKPIVVLRQKSESPISDLVAPKLHTVAVMLPYSGVHHLILEEGKEPAYVMTSANMPGLPMIIDNQDALGVFKNKLDFFLFHNRQIVNRCDDSIIRLVNENPVFLRRSRGYAPMPYHFRIPSDCSALALGGDLCVTATFVKNGRFYSSQHIGDASHLETLEFLRQAIDRLAKLLRVPSVDMVICDLHPHYSTTREAKQIAEHFGARAYQVQHHYAHLAGLMAEHGAAEAIGIVADGAGYGTDGKIWGGEVIIAERESMRRIGGLSYQPMVGGDLATIYPARMVAGILSRSFTLAKTKRVLLEHCLSGFPKGEKEIDTILHQLERNVNVHWTSSTGRVLDAISCLLGICNRRTYEGEPAMKLESAAALGDPTEVELSVVIKKENDRYALDTTTLLTEILNALRKRVPRKHIAASAQQAVARGLGAMAVKAAESTGIRTIGVSGGVFYNDTITRTIHSMVEEHGYRFISHREVPPGDGGLSVGQAALALTRPKQLV